jgi:acyl-ACP thioesterase
MSYQPLWREKLQVRSFDVGLNAMTRMSSLCGYMQEAAGRHANHLDVGYHYMKQSGKVWVLSRLFININQLPAWGQEFFIETWPLGTERIFYRRDYQIDDGKTVLLSATSYWILLDLNTRKPSFVELDEAVLRHNQGRHSMPMPSDTFREIVSDVYQIHRVKYSDLDQNRHVNNARYVEWIFDALNQDLLEKTAPVYFAIEYKHEAKAGDVVELRTSRLDEKKPAFAVEGRFSDSNQVSFRSKIIF